MRINQNCMNGTSISAISSEIIRTMVTAHGKLWTKSLTMPLVVSRKGKNVTLMASVADRIERKKCSALSIEACQRDMPSARRSI